MKKVKNCDVGYNISYVDPDDQINNTIDEFYNDDLDDDFEDDDLDDDFEDDDLDDDFEDDDLDDDFEDDDNNDNGLNGFPDIKVIKEDDKEFILEVNGVRHVYDKIKKEWIGGAFSFMGFGKL